MWEYTYTPELYHHGVLGMKWGIRRYQPYPSGERVKGGKEVGQATKVQQRTDKKIAKHTETTNKKISKLSAKSERLKETNVKLSDKREKLAVKSEKAAYEAAKANAKSARSALKAYRAGTETSLQSKLHTAAENQERANFQYDEALAYGNKSSRKTQKAIKLRAKVAQIDFKIYDNNRTIQKIADKSSKLSLKDDAYAKRMSEKGKRYIEELKRKE